MNVCDTRDACDIISPGGTCIHTSLDRGITSTLPALYPTMTCSSAMCSASSVIQFDRKIFFVKISISML